MTNINLFSKVIRKLKMRLSIFLNLSNQLIATNSKLKIIGPDAFSDTGLEDSYFEGIRKCIHKM